LLYFIQYSSIYYAWTQTAKLKRNRVKDVRINGESGSKQQQQNSDYTKNKRFRLKPLASDEHCFL
jgi:hypothetical protein